MQLQYPIDIYWREGDCVVDWMHTSFYEGVLNEVNPFFYRSRVEQSSPLPPRTMLIIYWTFMYIVNDNFGSFRRCRGLDDGFWCRLSLFPGCANILLKVFGLDKFLHQVMQTLALFNGVVVILMVGAPSVPILSSRIYFDWLQPFEVW